MPPTSTRWPPSWPSWSAPTGSPSRPTPTCSTASRSSAGTPSTSGWTRRCRGFGFARDEWSKPPAALSGGEQTRAALARLVIADPDLLLLDEPTNHLDLDALEWLEEHLRRRAGSLLVASHDRAFLDATVGRIWELRDRHLTVFRGDYSQYHRQREERDARLDKDVDIQAESIARERELVQRYRSHRKFSKMHEHEARLERLLAERIEAPKATRKLKLATRALTGAGPSRSGEVVVRAEDLAVGYLPRLRREDDRRAHGARRAEGRRPDPVPGGPARGADRDRRAQRRGQDHPAPDDRRRAAADRRPADPGRRRLRSATWPSSAARRSRARPCSTRCSRPCPITTGEARGYLARFLFRGDDTLKEVRALSGGERSRLELALLGIMPANLLLLDEPTNHLDIPAREAIESFMRETPATLLVVSHDRRMLETVCDRLWVVDGGSAVAFEGGYRAWRAAVADGWTVAGAIETEAKRLRTGGRPVAGTVVAAAAGGGSSAAVGLHGRWPLGGRIVDQRVRSRVAGGAAATLVEATAAGAAGGPTSRRTRGPKLSKDAYRRQRAALDAELTRLGAAQEPPRAGDGRPDGRGQLRRAPPDLERAGRRLHGARDRRGGLARARGARAVSRGRPCGPAPDRPDRPDRLREIHGRPALATHGAKMIDADRLARAVTAPGEPALAAIVKRFGPEVLTAEGRSTGPRSAGAYSTIRPSSARSRRSPIRPSGRGVMAALEAADATDAPAVVLEAIRLVEGGYADLLDEVWLVVLRSGRAAGAAGATQPRPGRSPAADRPQAGLVERVRPVATRIIDTSGDLGETEVRVDAALGAALARSGRLDRQPARAAG